MSGSLITCPFLLIITSSPSFRSSAEITIPQTTLPVLSVTFTVLIPEPPRFCTLYSLAGVALPYPSSVTIRISRSFAPLVNTSAETIASPLLNFIAVTPEAVRPISRTSVSLKRIDWPPRVTSDSSSPLPTKRAEISESASLSVIAIRPLRRTSLNEAASLFLATPFWVNIIKLQSPSQSSLRTASTEVTFSSELRGKKFIIDLPRVAFLPSGISYIFVL